MNRIVVTGMGTINPLGGDIQEMDQSLKDNKSGIVPLDEDLRKQYGIEHENLGVSVIAPVRGDVKRILLDHGYTQGEIRKMSRAVKLARIAVKEAIDAAWAHELPGSKKGLFLANSIGGFENIVKGVVDGRNNLASNRYRPKAINQGIIATQGFDLAQEYELDGIAPKYAPEACAASLAGISDAMKSLKMREIDLAVVCGVEAGIQQDILGSFGTMKALSKKGVSRPLDFDRDGFVMGEAAGALVLETLTSAKSRGVPILAEIAGVGSSFDRYHVTAPNPEGAVALRAMQKALQYGGLRIEDIEGIYLHGTSTPLGDIAEMKAIKKLVEHYRVLKGLYAPKSRAGHTLGAAGMLAVIEAILNMQGGYATPIKNLQYLDPKIEDVLGTYYTNLVKQDGVRDVHVKHALVNAFGFGGINYSVAVSGASTIDSKNRYRARLVSRDGVETRG